MFNFVSTHLNSGVGRENPAHKEQCVRWPRARGFCPSLVRPASEASRRIFEEISIKDLPQEMIFFFFLGGGGDIIVAACRSPKIGFPFHLALREKGVLLKNTTK